MLTEWGRIRIWDINVEYFSIYTMITEIQSVGPEIVIHFREKMSDEKPGRKETFAISKCKSWGSRCKMRKVTYPGQRSSSLKFVN